MDVQLELSQRKGTRMIRTVWMHVLVQSFLSPDEPTGYARCFNAMQTLYLTLQLAKPDGGAMLSLSFFLIHLSSKDFLHVGPQVPT